MALSQFLLDHKKPILVMAAVILIPVAVVAGVALTAEHREVATGWDLRGVSDDGRTLAIRYTTTPNCESLARVEKRETAERLALRVIIQETLGCDTEDRAVAHTTEVELARPLGDRELVDARTGRAPEPLGGS
jgi:hypothetical protein